ncbi:MAG: membrane protein [Myxococcota bacterium]|jgi:membrane protein
MQDQLRRLYTYINDRLEKRWTRPLLIVILFSVAVWRQAVRDKLPIRAAMLSYWTTVAIVPMLLLAFAMTGAVGLASNQVRDLMYEVLLSSSVEDVGSSIDTFLSSTSLGTLGVVGVFSIMLIGAQLYFQAEKAYNDIFYCRPRQSLITRFFGFYAALTLAPMIIAGGFVVTGKLTEVPEASFIADIINYILPSLMTAIAFVGAIRFLPSVKVSWRAALWGGLTSALLFEAAKRGFGSYTEILGTKDSMAMIYGSLGLLPVFLLWLNVLWTIVLVGVEVAYVREHWVLLVEQQRQWVLDPHAEKRHPDVFFALAVMHVVCSRYLDGEGPSSSDHIIDTLSADARHVQMTLDHLVDARLLLETEDTRYVPARPLDRTPTRMVVGAWRTVTAPSIDPAHPSADLLSRSIEALADSLDAPLSETMHEAQPRSEVVT